MTDASELIALIESAFKPLRCVAELQDYQFKTCMRIYDPEDQPLLTAEVGKTQELLDNKHQLASVLEAFRAHVEDRGFSLEPWSPS